VDGGATRRRQLAAFDPLPDDAGAGAGEDLLLSFDEEEPSFDVDEPLEEAVSDEVADVRLSVR
jgi:hypothetical protein